MVALPPKDGDAADEGVAAEEGEAADDGEEAGPRVEVETADMGDAAADGEETVDVGKRSCVRFPAIVGMGLSRVCLLGCGCVCVCVCGCGCVCVLAFDSIRMTTYTCACRYLPLARPLTEASVKPSTNPTNDLISAQNYDNPVGSDHYMLGSPRNFAEGSKCVLDADRPVGCPCDNNEQCFSQQCDKRGCKQGF